MKVKREFLLIITAVILSLCFLLTGPAMAGMDMKHARGAGGHGMSMHHQHIMLNHGLGMALESSNLLMLGQMGMAKGVDEVSIEHGKMMMKNGKNLLNETMSGDVMMKMHRGGQSPADNPMMKSTHQLAEAQLKVMGLLEEMSSVSGAGHGMSMHHQHIMLNHALGMALEGSNLLMLGQMGMAKGVDEVSIEHGKMMMKNAESLFNETMSGGSMMKMHDMGKTPKENAAMASVHKLAEAELKVMNLLKKM